MKLTINRSRIRSFILFFRAETSKALLKTYQPVIDKASTTPAEALKRVTGQLLDTEHIEEVLKNLYQNVPSDFAKDISKRIRTRKDEDNWIDLFRNYANDRSKKIAKRIVTTQEANINTTIDRVLTRMTAEGASIERITQGLQDELIDELTNIADWEAQRIAQTEVIGSANYGSFTGAQAENIEGMQKAWITSGNANVRDSHMEYQGLGAVDMDYEYNEGLKFPGDPDCEDPSETVNCHCTVVYTFD